MYQLGRYYFLRTPSPVVSRWLESRVFESPDDFQEPRFVPATLFEFSMNDDIYLVDQDTLLPLYPEDELVILLEEYGVDVVDYYKSMTRSERYLLLKHCNPTGAHDFISRILDDRLFTTDFQIQVAITVFNDEAKRFLRYRA